MPGVRRGIIWDLPRSRLAVTRQLGLARLLRERNYGTALVLPRTWKAAIAPALAGIPERVGFVGEFRFGLINRWRWGEKQLPASSTRTPPSPSPMARPCRRNGRCRNCAFRRRRSPAGGRPMGSAPGPQ